MNALVITLRAPPSRRTLGSKDAEGGGQNYEYFRPLLAVVEAEGFSHHIPSVTDEQRAPTKIYGSTSCFARNLGTVEMFTRNSMVASERKWPSCPSHSIIARYVSLPS